MSSDYTPPAVVKPTPGGAAGDGSIDGALELATVDGYTAKFQVVPSLPSNFQTGSPNAPHVRLIPIGTGSANDGWTMGLTQPGLSQRLSSAGYAIINSGGGNPAVLNWDNTNDCALGQNGKDFYFSHSGAKVTWFAQIAALGKGLAPIYGLDNRTGVTTADASPITLYTTTAAGQVYRITLRVNATAYTSGTASYVLSWTEGGAVLSMRANATATNQAAAQSTVIQPDNGTAITVQLTGAFVATVNVAATVEQMA